MKQLLAPPFGGREHKNQRRQCQNKTRIRARRDSEKSLMHTRSKVLAVRAPVSSAFQGTDGSILLLVVLSAENA